MEQEQGFGRSIRLCIAGFVCFHRCKGGSLRVILYVLSSSGPLVRDSGRHVLENPACSKTPGPSCRGYNVERDASVILFFSFVCMCVLHGRGRVVNDDLLLLVEGPTGT